ncbi:MAG: hypothetical protein LRZ84_23865 [Desertifilum sp.]|nr:hypothetical protein [Desertifilum sp.]
MTPQPQLPSPEILQKTVDNWQGVCNRIDAAIALLDRAHEMIETHILSNPIAAYRLRGHRSSTSRRLLDD